MTDRQGHSARRRRLARAALGVSLLTTACGRGGSSDSVPLPDTLRIGVAQVELGPVLRTLTLEGIGRATSDGRVKPWLANSWTVAPDGLSILIELRPNVKFHDNSSASASDIADVLRKSLPELLGPADEDVADIATPTAHTVEIRLRQRSPLVLEALETAIEKPGAPGVGTGPYVAGPSQTALNANEHYYLGRPAIEHVTVSKYPSVRTAWAELLRNRLDMVYEVGLDALDSLQTATTVNVFRFRRWFQYLVLLNSTAPVFRSSEVRRALNAAIDRDALIREALDGHGTPSNGPVWPNNWAAGPALAPLKFDPAAAAAFFGHGNVSARPAHARFTFTCLVASGNERLALAIKRQLESVGVEMATEEATVEEINRARSTHAFEAILVDATSGPSMLRPYMWWHSRGLYNRGIFSSAEVDRALESIRHAASDSDYRAGVTRFQEAILADPPAIFLAWNERARAVSSRFEIPVTEPGVDVLSVLRLWRPLGPEELPSNSN